MSEFSALLLIACPMVLMVTMPIWLIALILLSGPTDDTGNGAGKREAKAYLIETLQGLQAANKFRQSEQDKLRNIGGKGENND